jgi:O-antigen/teichoic acid export membrane protein
LILTSAGFFVYRQSDILMIQFFLGTDDVAFYHAQSRIVQMLHIPVIAVGASVAPYFSRGRIDLQSQRDIFQRCMHFILLLYVPAAVGMTLLAVPIIDLVYGVEFMPAASAFSVYTLLYTPSFAVAAVISLLLNYRGRAMHRAGIISVTALANIALNILLIPKFGIVGAAASTQLTYTPAVACYIYLATGDLGVSRAQILLGLRKILVATLVMAVAIFVLASAIPHPRVALTLIPIGAAVYFATARIVGAVTAEDISAFKGLFRKRRIEA